MARSESDRSPTFFPEERELRNYRLVNRTAGSLVPFRGE